VENGFSRPAIHVDLAGKPRVAEAALRVSAQKQGGGPR
jgi:hypothetical protein